MLGGGDGYPLSHISSGIADVVKWIKLIRFLDAEGSFHFVHGRDIAQVVRHLVEHSATEDESRDMVLGNEKITVNQAIEETCDYLNQKSISHSAFALAGRFVYFSVSHSNGRLGAVLPSLSALHLPKCRQPRHVWATDLLCDALTTF